MVLTARCHGAMKHAHRCREANAPNQNCWVHVRRGARLAHPCPAWAIVSGCQLPTNIFGTWMLPAIHLGPGWSSVVTSPQALRWVDLAFVGLAHHWRVRLVFQALGLGSNLGPTYITRAHNWKKGKLQISGYFNTILHI